MEQAKLKWKGRSRVRKLISSQYYLPVNPSWMRVSQSVMIADHGVVDFLVCLKHFLWSVDPIMPTLPHKQDHFSVYKRFTIVSKAINRFQEEEMKDDLRATPRPKDSLSMSRKDIFDMVLVHEDD